MTSFTQSTVKVIQEKYYAKLWIGEGAPPSALEDIGTPTDDSEYFADPVARGPVKIGSTVYEDKPLPVTPQLGWFYIDASTGDLYIWSTTGKWGSAVGTWTGGFLCSDRLLI